MRDDAALGRALPLDRGLGPLEASDLMVNDTYSDIISNAGSIYKYTIYLHNPHFLAPVRSPVRTSRFSSQNNHTTKFYIARADSAPPTTPHASMSLTDSPGPGVAARRRGSNSVIGYDTIRYCVFNVQ